MDPNERKNDFDRELRTHLELEAEEQSGEGISEREAMHRARRAFGNTTIAAEDVRAVWGSRWLEDAWRDVRYGVRLLLKNPGFALVAALTLALGIGASVTIFSVVNSVLIRSLPYGDAGRLVYMWTPLPRYAALPKELAPSFADVLAWRNVSRSFTSITAFRQRTLTVDAGAEPVRVVAGIVLGGFFDTLQTAPLLGRTIDEGDDRAGAEGVAVISHAFWDSQFGSDPAALGKLIQVSGSGYRVVGIMPAEFSYPRENDFPLAHSTLRRTEIWIPARLTTEQQANRMSTADAAIGRLGPGVTLQQAQSEMSAIENHLDELNLPEMRGSKLLLVPFIETAVGPVRPLMQLLSGAVFLVLLIACGNVANLLMARAMSRTHEMGVRTSLGAPRVRLVRQVLTESLLLSMIGGGLGVMLAKAALKILTTLNPGDIPRFDEISIDGRALLVALLVSVGSALAFGILPALASSRASVNDAMRKAGGRGSTSGSARIRNGLIIADVALAVVLLTGTGLLIRSYLYVQGEDKGFAPSTLTMVLSADPRTHSEEQMETVYRTATERLSALPGVVAVGTTNSLPLDHTDSTSTFRIEGYPNQPNQQARLRRVAGKYFEAMQIRLISGRYLEHTDMPAGGSAAARNVVVSESFAKLYFSDKNPIGGHVQRGEAGPVWETIVGVVSDVYHSSLEKAPQPTLYEPSWAAESIAIRTVAPPEAMISSARSTIHDIDSGVALSDVETMRQRTSEATARRRFQTVLLSAFAGIAMLLALVGLYGMLSYMVKQRTVEIGIRLALGATRLEVVQMVLRRGLAFTGVGLAVGLLVAVAVARWSSSLLYGIRTLDPATFILLPLLMILAATLACALPAWRACRVDPVTSLREQ
ncbi:MAG TPA: ABC transporter permease [Candidatus Acidoferrum sp.]|jgi:putative ABC transport system permease protein